MRVPRASTHCRHAGGAQRLPGSQAQVPGGCLLPAVGQPAHLVRCTAPAACARVLGSPIGTLVNSHLLLSSTVPTFAGGAGSEACAAGGQQGWSIVRMSCCSTANQHGALHPLCSCLPAFLVLPLSGQRVGEGALPPTSSAAGAARQVQHQGTASLSWLHGLTNQQLLQAMPCSLGSPSATAFCCLLPATAVRRPATATAGSLPDPCALACCTSVVVDLCAGRTKS